MDVYLCCVSQQYMHFKIFISSLCTLLNDGYAMNVHNNRPCRSCFGQLSQFQGKYMYDLQILLKNKRHKMISRLLHLQSMHNMRAEYTQLFGDEFSTHSHDAFFLVFPLGNSFHLLRIFQTLKGD